MSNELTVTFSAGEISNMERATGMRGAEAVEAVMRRGLKAAPTTYLGRPISKAPPRRPGERRFKSGRAAMNYLKKL